MRIESLYNANQHALSFQRGEEKAFDFFFRQLFPSLCFFANRILNDTCEAEDIASSAFIKIWKKHSQFDNARNIRSYLYQIVRNDCLKSLQQSTRAAAAQKEIKYLANVNVDDNCEADIIRSEFLCELYNTLNNLPAECRRIFKMLYIEGKTVKETARELKLSLSTVKTQKARGLAVFKKKFIYTSFILFLLLF